MHHKQNNEEKPACQIHHWQAGFLNDTLMVVREREKAFIR
jgi:hypothetical protein